MALQDFDIGSRVTVKTIGRIGGPSGLYTVVSALPPSDGQRQYRLKSDAEKFERIVQASRIEAAADI